jgi:D-glycero-D-manno-heptose 1,7-bisphosphate phosphatase
MKRAVFLDRDGTLNQDRPNYVKSWREFRWLPDVVAPLLQLQAGGFELIVVTNQAAIAKGLTTGAKVEEIHQMMVETLRARGVDIRAVYYCPHGERDGCDCRKPKPGLLQQAARDCVISLALSWVVGDRSR